MNKRHLLERLLGAVLVCAMGFVLYSAILDSSENTHVDRSTQIPLQTQFVEPLEMAEPLEPFETPETEVEALFVPDREISEVIISDDQSQPATDSEAPILNSAGLPNSWVIQVGSFSSQDKAAEIVDQLVAEQMRAYYREIPGDQGPLYRVLVGPYLNNDEADKDGLIIDQKLNLSSILMTFEA